MKDRKTVLFAFRGDPMCFVHVLLNGIDLHKRGRGGSIVIEGEAVKVIQEIADTGHFLNSLYFKAKELGLIDGACKACSAKLKVTEIMENEGIRLIGDMSGHPAMGAYMEKGYEIITF